MVDRAELSQPDWRTELKGRLDSRSFVVDRERIHMGIGNGSRMTTGVRTCYQ